MPLFYAVKGVTVIAQRSVGMGALNHTVFDCAFVGEIVIMSVDSETVLFGAESPRSVLQAGAIAIEAWHSHAETERDEEASGPVEDATRTAGFDRPRRSGSGGG